MCVAFHDKAHWLKRTTYSWRNSRLLQTCFDTIIILVWGYMIYLCYQQITDSTWLDLHVCLDRCAWKSWFKKGLGTETCTGVLIACLQWYMVHFWSLETITKAVTLCTRLLDIVGVCHCLNKIFYKENVICLGISLESCRGHGSPWTANDCITCCSMYNVSNNL